MIYIATHKEFKNPQLYGFVPLQVGAEGKKMLGYLTDNVGDNISNKNPNFCELTGLYWVWKNCSDDYKGIVHYRRFFGKSNFSNSIKDVYTYEQLISMLDTADIILPFVEIFKQDTKNELLLQCCTKSIFENLERIIKSKYPEYSRTFDEYFSRNESMLFNMMFCKKELFDQYCSWLFDILFELEKYVDLNELNDYQKRLYGFLSERLLNIWVRENKVIIKNVPVVNIDMSLWDRLTLIRRRITNKVFWKIKTLKVNKKQEYIE
jgi:hypothetical protein